MRENLGKFLADVSSDPDRLVRFAEDPTSQFGGADLSDSEKTALQTGDSREVTDALGESGMAIGDVSNGITPMKAPTRKAPARKAPARKAPARKRPAKKAPRKKAPARRAPAKKTPSRRAPAKKTSRKAAKKTSRKASRKAAPRARKSGGKKR
jgi:hypothetical protein